MSNKKILLTTIYKYCSILLEDRGERKMKNMKGKKGFTLIELLAVIVVLAIIMVLATSTVLPMISSARKGAFATEANTMLDNASQVISLSQLDSLDLESNVTKVTQSKATVYCFTLANLKALGYLDKDLTGYEGTVAVRIPTTGNVYTYYVSMTNGTYFVNQTKSADVVEKDIKDVNDTTGKGKNDVRYDCADTNTAVTALSKLK